MKYVNWFICRREWEANSFELPENDIAIPEVYQRVVANLAELPKFVRFNKVKLDYCDGYAEIFAESNYLNGEPIKLPIAEKCLSLLANYLQPLKKALNDSVLIHFFAAINGNDPNCFSNGSQLLSHVQNELVQICDSSRGYKFEIGYFCSEMNDSTNVIASILQMDPIVQSSHVEIIFHRLSNLNFLTPQSDFQHHTRQLPIELISNWLHRKSKAINENSKGRFLQINLRYIQNAPELCDYLKEVIVKKFCRFSHPESWTISSLYNYRLDI